MAVLKWMLKLALLPLLLLLILAQWVGIFLATFSTILTNLLAGLFFFVALASWVMKLTAGGTAGHINPALAIAGALKKADPTAEIHFAGGAVLLRGSDKLGHEAGRRRRSPENADYRICGFRPALHSDSCYRQNLLFR